MVHRAAAAVIVIVASGAVLVLELLSVRLVAPYVGVSHETYTAAIGIALAAIAVGAAQGGRAADRRDGRLLIGWLFLAAGALTLLAQPVVTVLGPAFRGVGPVGAIVMVGLAIAVPVGLLSAIPPVVVKAQLAQLAETGTVVGWFSAVGTVGGLLGTFLTGYVLLYALPVSIAMLSTALPLVVLGVWQLGARRRAGGAMPPGSTKRGAQLCALMLVGSAAWAFTPEDCTVETPYFCARVVDDDDRPTGQYLMLDDLPHAYVDQRDPTYLAFAYTRRFADVVDASYPADQPVRVLHIGGGGFTMPRWFDATRPGSTHTVMELDRHVIDLAEREFGRPSDDVVDVRAGDARVEIEQEADDRYDVVLGDAFTSRSVPWHLATEQFHEQVRRVLAPDGVYMLNVIDHPPFELLGAEIATLREVFGDVRVLADEPILDGVDGDGTGGNVVLVAGPGVASPAGLAEQAAADPHAPSDATDETAPVRMATRARVDELARGAEVLTDDFAPTEQLLTPPGSG